MPAAQDIISDCLGKLGVYAPGETVSTDDYSTGLSVLNLLVEEWLGERIGLYQRIALTFTMVVGQWAYTIGQSNQANIVTRRPDRLEMGAGTASTLFGGVTAALDVISALEWDAFAGNPDDPNFTARPDHASYQPDYPLGLLRFSPPPDQAYTVSILNLQPFTTFADQTTVYTLGTETDSALRYNLAAALKPYFQTAKLPDEVAVLASHTKMHLRFLYRQSRATIRPDAKPPRAAPAPPVAQPAPVR